jgi:hypothetical protein
VNLAHKFTPFGKVASRVRLPLLLLAIAASPLSAQEWTGRIEASTDSAPVAGALVILIDSLGREARRTLSSPTGGFSLPLPGAGRYQVRVLRIGYAGWLSPPHRFDPGQRRETRLVIEDRIIQLAAIEVTTTRSRCGVRPGDGDIIASLLNEAEKALAITDQTIRQGNLRFRTETYVSRPTADGGIGERNRSSSSGQAFWPVASAHPDTLAKYGFVHEPARSASDPTQTTGPVYFGPDARVLFADWFLDAHCFSVDPARDSARTIVVSFAPARGARRDIRGRLTLDRQTLELRALDFWYTGLGRWVTGDSAGGSMSFHKLKTGAWIIDRWLIRAPIPLVGGRDTVLFGFAESGGRVREIRDGRSGGVERLSRAVPDLPSDNPPITNFSYSTMTRSDLCAHHGGCWADLSSSPSSPRDKSRPRSRRWMTKRSSAPIDSRPVPT